MRKASRLSLLLAAISFLLAAVGTQLLARRLYARQHREPQPLVLRPVSQPGYQVAH